MEQRDDASTDPVIEPSRRHFLRSLSTVSTIAILVACDDDTVGAGGDASSGVDADADTSTNPDAPAGADGVGADADANADVSADVGLADGDVPLCEVTGADVEGPFYLDGAPSRTSLADELEPGDRLRINGRVTDRLCNPIANALLDVWQADSAGDYHDETTEYRLRGQLMTDQNGEYSFDTIKPGNYPQGGSFRPAHIHFIVSAPGMVALTTQMYFGGDTYLSPNDPCGGCNSGDDTLIVELDEGGEVSTGFFEIVLERV